MGHPGREGKLVMEEADNAGKLSNFCASASSRKSRGNLPTSKRHFPRAKRKKKGKKKNTKTKGLGTGESAPRADGLHPRLTPKRDCK